MQLGCRGAEFTDLSGATCPVMRPERAVGQFLPVLSVETAPTNRLGHEMPD
jgi:hypothetical protein